MKRFGIIFMSLLVILSVPFIAAAAEKDMGIYIGLLGGWVIPSDMSTHLIEKGPGGGSIYDNVGLKDGWLAGAKVGYLVPATNRMLAVEFEYNHIENDFDSGKGYVHSGVTRSYDSKVKADAFMFNLIGRYPQGRIVPYVGGGIGYANVAIDDIKVTSAGRNTLNYSSGSQGVFAYQILLGVDYDFTKNWFAGLGYKYFHANKVSYDNSITSPIVPGSSPGSVDALYKSHNIVVTLGYKF
jgi:opacity protein-like surface antigen